MFFPCNQRRVSMVSMVSMSIPKWGCWSQSERSWSLKQCPYDRFCWFGLKLPPNSQILYVYVCDSVCVCVCMNDYIYKLNDTTQQNCICFRSQHLRPFVCVLNWCSHSLHMYLMCANTQIKHKSWQSLSSSRFIKWMMNVYKPCLHCTMIANIIQAPSDNSSIHGEGWLVETGLKSPTLAALLKTRWSTVTRCPLTHHVSGISRGLPYASIGWENLNQLRREKIGSHNHCLFNVFKDINHSFQLIISNQMLSYHFR